MPLRDLDVPARDWRTTMISARLLKASSPHALIFALALLTLAFPLFASPPGGPPPDEPDPGRPEREARMLVRILLERPEAYRALEDMRLDLASLSFAHGADVIVTRKELGEIEKRGFSYEILVADPSEIEIDPEYRDYEETLAYLDSLHQEYPDLTTLAQVGASQEYGIPLWAMKISDNAATEEDELEILYNGVHHAREPLGNEICLGIARTLLEGYGTDPDITGWVDTEEIWIVPIVNTEGFTYVMDNNLEDPWWRKNQRDNNENGVFDDWYDGVDLNRNYDFNWETGGDSDPASWVYRGPAPFSESETQAIRDLATLSHRFVFAITYHSYGEVVLYPWAWGGHEPPDLDVISEVAEQVATRIPTRNGWGTYAFGTLEGWVGYSSNWMYGIGGCIEILIETCDEFIPSGTAIDSVVAANVNGALTLLERVHGPGITGHVTDSGTGLPLQAEVVVLERDTEDIELRTSDPFFGRYVRLLPPGVYAVKYALDGYEIAILEVTVDPDSLTVFDVALTKTVSLALADTLLDDDNSGGSQGNGDGLLNPGETIELSAWLENNGFLTAPGVSAVLRSSDPLLVIADSLASYGDIDPGEVILGDAPFLFSVSGEARDGHLVSLELAVSDTAWNSWIYELEFPVHAAELSYMSKAVDDSEGGDGDNIPEAGEQVDLIMLLRNTGSMDASGVWVDLSASDPYLEVTGDSASFGDLEAGRYAMGSPPFGLSISPDAPDTHTVTLTLAIHAEGYYEEEEITLHLGSVGIEEPEGESPMPRVTQLSQNFPNPFNPSTRIEFDLAGSGDRKVPVRLSVYSLRGRLVRELLRNALSPGRHSVVWNGIDGMGAPSGSGIYILVLETPAGTYSRKLVLQR
jgi:hypothetical protein